MSARLKTSGPAGVTRRFVFLPWLSGGRQASQLLLLEVI